MIYDYFGTLFKKEVTNEYVHNIWLSAEYVLEKCEEEYQKKIIKALAIILIVNKEEEIPANSKYLSLSINVPDCIQEIDRLIDAALTGKTPTKPLRARPRFPPRALAMSS